MNIIFVCGDTPDYLSTSILHGLKELKYVNVLDYPKAEFLYKSEKSKLKDLVRGNGFTLFFLLEDYPLNRANVKLDKVIVGDYDLIIFADIKSNFGLYYEYLPFLESGKTAILDGSDSTALFGDSGEFWKRPIYWFIPRPQNRFRYYKREWVPSEINYARCIKLLPKWLSNFLPQKPLLRKISFSIPEEKIVKFVPVKTKLFASHIVDDEVRILHTQKCSGGYLFESEVDYYNDIRTSKFAITTKRAGWDCLRHYEIAANGTVLCFRDLEKKPEHCAPHGLVPNVNCLSYSSYNELMDKVSNMTNDQYEIMLSRSFEWIRNNTTKVRAANLISEFNSVIFE